METKEDTMAIKSATITNCTTTDGLADLQFLIIELEKKQPNLKLIKTLTTKYGIPYKVNVADQLNELLTYLNNLNLPNEIDPLNEI